MENNKRSREKVIISEGSGMSHEDTRAPPRQRRQPAHLKCLREARGAMRRAVSGGVTFAFSHSMTVRSSWARVRHRYQTRELGRSSSSSLAEQRGQAGDGLFSVPGLPLKREGPPGGVVGDPSGTVEEMLPRANHRPTPPSTSPCPKGRRDCGRGGLTGD